jgi:hypothetical protein
VQGFKGSRHTIPRWGLVCAGERQNTLAPIGLGHTAYNGGTHANVQTIDSNMQMLGVWAFVLVCVRVGTI